jgi:hypothetical protein
MTNDKIRPRCLDEVRPNVVKRVWNRIRFMLPGDWVPDNFFSGRFGPIITNLAFASEKGALERAR